MKFQSEKVNQNKIFSLGKDIVRDEYIMAITVCGIAWYERYFSISKEEFDLYDENYDVFINIYNECMELGIKSDRFLCSDKVKENTLQQLERLREGKLLIKHQR